MTKTNPDQEIQELRDQMTQKGTERAELEGEIAAAKAEQVRAGTRHLERDIALKGIRVTELAEEHRAASAAITGVIRTNPDYFKGQAGEASEGALTAHEAMLEAIRAAGNAYTEAEEAWATVREVGRQPVGHLPEPVYTRLLDEVHVRVGGNVPWPGGRRPEGM
jgi:hypothetical protein